MPDLDALLRRIGSHAGASLADLHRAYVTAIPFDDLTIQLGEQAPLDRDAIARRLIEGGGRGGYCFEVNDVLGWLLEQLGHDVRRYRAVVGPRGVEAPVNHLALIVDGEWLAEAGYGEGPLEPLALRSGRQDGWLLEPDGDDGWWVGDERPWTSGDGFTILPGEVGMDAFDEPHARLSTSEDSSFVQTLVVQQPQGDRVATLRARTFSVRGPAVDERRVLADVQDLDATLRGAFGIELDAARAARLWDAACAQHEAFLKRS
ncbi:MAG TPA: arylamine N-acetyltransferase [Solirubrobacteraceae bacterium]